MTDCDPKVDISIDGYQAPISTPTESSKGGVLIYVKSGINFKPRNDLNVYKSKELESLFIEIINKKESNDIIGVIYRHPCMNGTDFIDEYLKGIADKLSNENKKVFIAGEFNFDLLNVASHNETFEFFDTMMSNFLLPVITLPTKINRGVNTLIDNIFTNHLHPDTKSGNLEVNLSDGHLPSFMIMPRQNQNHLPKKHNIYTRKSKTFSRENFILDYINIDWDEVIDTNRKPFLSKLAKKTKQKFRKYLNCKNEVRKTELCGQFKMLKNEITHLTHNGKKPITKNISLKIRIIFKRSGKVSKKLLI